MVYIITQVFLERKMLFQRLTPLKKSKKQNHLPIGRFSRGKALEDLFVLRLKNKRKVITHLLVGGSAKYLAIEQLLVLLSLK